MPDPAPERPLQPPPPADAAPARPLRSRVLPVLLAGLAVMLLVGGGLLWRKLGVGVAGPLEEPRALKISRSEPVLHDPPGLAEGEDQALARIFAKLRALEDGKRDRVAVLQLGASHTTGQYFADRVRARLQQRFGSAGRGFVAPGEPEGDRPHTGVLRERKGTWRIAGAVHAKFGQRWGLSGVRGEAEEGAQVRFELCSDCEESPVPAKLEIFTLHRPDEGALEVLLDDRVVARLPQRPVKRERVNVHRLSALGARQQLTLRAVGPGPAVVLGVSHELSRPGLVYDTAGLSGSTAWVPAGYQEDAFTAQLKARRPDLYVLFWGTNEAVSDSLDATSYSRTYLKLLGTLRAAAPEADCLILGPTDRLVPRESATWSPAPSQEVVISTLRQVARQAGCAFWSPRAAMGGDGSMREWQAHAPPWALPDGTHLTREGYHALADLLVDDLIGAFAKSRRPVPRTANRGGNTASGVR